MDPQLVIHDEAANPFTVRYEAVNAMLLNEFLKGHRKVQEQHATSAYLKNGFESKFAQQQKQIEALTANVKQRASQIQKVRAEPERSKAAP